MKRPIKIAFFGHDSTDAAIRRRITAFQDDGLNVVGYMMHRRDPGHLDWENIDLGETKDGAFLHRIRAIFRGAEIARTHANALVDADLIYARNLDMLALAFLAKRKLNLDVPVVYECLDVHRKLSGTGLISKILRIVEGRLLARCAGLIVSSPGFIKHHFEIYYPGSYDAYLVENRLASAAGIHRRPAAMKVPESRPLQIGWVGILRCKRSLELLAQVADSLPEKVHIHLHGLPARNEIPVFEPVIESRPNMTYHGRYASPEDLHDIYRDLDLVWAGDFMEAGHNSVWLLPNRIYEGGYYGVPALAPSQTETANWIESHGVGLTVNEPLEHELQSVIARLEQNRDKIDHYKSVLSKKPKDIYVQPPGFLSNLIRQILEGDKG